MHDALVVLVDGELLVGEGIRFQRDLELVRRLQTLVKLVRLGLMDAVGEVEGCVALACLLASQWEFLRSFLDVLVAEEGAVEAVDGGALVFRGLELGRVEAQGVVRAAC